MSDPKRRALLYDDIPDRADQLARELKQEGIDVVIPSSRQEALDRLRAEPDGFDFILMDHHFSRPTEGSVLDLRGGKPLASGLDLVEQMSKINPTVPIILYTTVPGGRIDPAEAVARGAYRVVAHDNVPHLVRDLIERMNELGDITRSLSEIQDSRRSMESMIAGLGVGLQVVDWHGRVWFRDATFRRIVGESGRPHRICYCLSHGYPLDHGVCANCVVREAIERNEERFGIFYLPTYPGGPGTKPVFQYLSVQVSPIRRRPKSGLSIVENGAIAAMETVSQLSDNSVLSLLSFRTHLEVLTRALVDMGFKRVRIYRAKPTTVAGQSQWAIEGLCFYGWGTEQLEPSTVVYLLDRQPEVAKGKAGELAKWLPTISPYLPDADAKVMDERLRIDPRYPPLDVALFDAAGDFLGWVAVDNVGVGGHDEPVLPESLDPKPAEGCIPASPMEVMREIARVLATRPFSADQPVPEALKAERAFNRICNRLATNVNPDPAGLLVSILEAVQAEVPEVPMAHVRRLEDKWAVSVASIGEYGRVAEERIDIHKSKRMTAGVAITGVPDFIDDIQAEGNMSPAADEFAPMQWEIIRSFPSHAVYPLLSQGKAIGTVSFQSRGKAFFTGHRRHLFQMIADLLAGALRDYLNHLRHHAQAIAADLGKKAAMLVIHNVNHPVGVISGRVLLARMDLKAGNTATMEEHLQAIDEQCRRIAEIRQDFGALVGSMTEKPDVVDLASEIRVIAADIRRETVHVDFIFDSVAVPDRVQLQPRSLRVVLTVLIRNALDALAQQAPRGTIRIVARRPGRAIPTEAPFADRCLAIDVVDSGPGVSQEALEHLFEPFRSHKEGGLGIGLAYARQMMRTVGGEVYYAGRNRQGTTFTVLLAARLES